jgi:prefoldin subunit 5
MKIINDGTSIKISFTYKEAKLKKVAYSLSQKRFEEKVEEIQKLNEEIQKLNEEIQKLNEENRELKKKLNHKKFEVKIYNKIITKKINE